MPRKTRTQTTKGAGSAEPTESAEPSTDATPAPSKRVQASDTQARKAGPKRTGAKAAAKKSGTKRVRKVDQTREPSDADIRLRAYFIAERRVQLALHGDPAKDWLEAKQQLLQEAAQKTA